MQRAILNRTLGGTRGSLYFDRGDVWADVVLDDVASAATGPSENFAAANITLDAITVSGTATATIPDLFASAGVTLGEITVSGTATFTPAPVFGAADFVVGGVTVSGAATFTPAPVSAVADFVLCTISIVGTADADAYTQPGHTDVYEAEAFARRRRSRLRR